MSGGKVAQESLPQFLFGVQEDLIVESLEEAPAAMRDGHGAVKHSSPLAAHMPDEPIQTAAAVSNNSAVDDHPSLTSPQCAQPQSDLEKGNPAPELMLPQVRS